MKSATRKPLTARQRADLDTVAEIPNDQIDTSDMSEQLDWSSAKRGMYYRPIKKQITLRLDADLIEWFRQHTTSDTGYQTRINEALREYVAQQGKR